jgi:hypothetical protein
VDPAGTSTPATVLVRRASRQSVLVGDSMRSVSSTRLGMRSGCSRSSSCSGEGADRLGEHARRGLLARGEQESGRAYHGSHVGGRAVRVPGQRESGHDVVARLAPAVLDVSGERARQPAECVALAGPVRLPQVACAPAKTEAGSYLAEVLVRHAEQFGDDQGSQR